MGADRGARAQVREFFIFFAFFVFTVQALGLYTLAFAKSAGGGESLRIVSSDKFVRGSGCLCGAARLFSVGLLL